MQSVVKQKSHYTVEQTTDAMIFARIMISSLELSADLVSDHRVNPFGIIPIVFDESLSPSIKQIFANIGYEKVSWQKLGVKYMPTSLLKEYGNYGVESKFTVSGCELLDCFGYSDTIGTKCKSCGPFNVKIDTLADREIVGCRPSCFLFKNISLNKTTNELLVNDNKRKRNDVNDLTAAAKPNNNESNDNQLTIPNNIHVYYDYEKNVCRLGCTDLRTYAECPKLRPQQHVRGISEMPPFYYDAQKQNCYLSEAYCTSFEVMKYDAVNNDCYLPVGQKIAELFLGRSVTRRAIEVIRNSDEYTRRVLEEKERERRRREALTYGRDVKHLETINRLIHCAMPIDDKADLMKNRSNNTRKQHVDESVKVIKKLGSGSLNLAEVAGIIFGANFSLQCVKLGAEKISATISEKLLERLAGVTVARGMAVLGTMFAEKALTTIAAETAVVFLDALASAVNPAIFALNVMMVASMFWDPIDYRFAVVTSKQELENMRNGFIRKWNQAHNISDASDKLAMFELKPMIVYNWIFGDFYDDKCRNANKHLKTLMYYSNKYLSAIDDENDNRSMNIRETQSETLQLHHVHHARKTFLSAFLEKYANNEREIEQQKLHETLKKVSICFSVMCAATVLPFIAWNLFTIFTFIIAIAIVVTYMSCNTCTLKRVEARIESNLRKFLRSA